MLYTASSIALALLEILVHVERDEIPEDYIWLRADVPDKLTPDKPPVTAFEDPATFGTNWLETANNSMILAVPSVIVPEQNFLLNPVHTDFSKIKWSDPNPLQIDPRLTGVRESTIRGCLRSTKYE